MRLFDETESKYYLLISYLLLQKRNFTGKDVDLLLSQLSYGEKDFQVLENLFSEREGEEVIFSYSDGKYKPLLDKHVPIRCNGIEQQAFGSIYNLPYADLFLREETIQKIRALENGTGSLPSNLTEIRNRHKRFDHASNPELSDSMLLITKAIREKRSIIYNNIKEGAYAFRQAEAFPVKIEYSVLQDVFRISAFEPAQNRFFMMTLETMQKIRLGANTREDVQGLYEDFLKKNKRTILLDVEPTGHVIERCFRLFSFYERKAVYDREADRYSLEITYHSYDEAELIRDILSLGSSVVVMKPAGIRRKVFERIKEAAGVLA